jgi:hypothetical protein
MDLFISAAAHTVTAIGDRQPLIMAKNHIQRSSVTVRLSFRAKIEFLGFLWTWMTVPASEWVKIRV